MEYIGNSKDLVYLGLGRSVSCVRITNHAENMSCITHDTERGLLAYPDWLALQLTVWLGFLVGYKDLLILQGLYFRLLCKYKPPYMNLCSVQTRL
jgi:hypothetical protein